MKKLFTVKVGLKCCLWYHVYQQTEVHIQIFSVANAHLLHVVG